MPESPENVWKQLAWHAGWLFYALAIGEAYPRETVRQATAAFVKSVHAQSGINIHFFLPFPSTDTTALVDIHVNRSTPPTFLIQAEDNPVDPVENSLVYYSALKKAGVPAELHVYMKGGHAFGMRRTDAPVTQWPELVETWLRSIGVLTN